MTFEVIPAIDLRGGRVVRLRRGDFGQETDYGENPATVAIQFANAGATAVHVVDLDGARKGQPEQMATIARVTEAVRDRISCEVAGGLRTIAAAEAAFDAGAAGVVVGTAAIRDPGFATALVERFGAERVTGAIDVRDGLAVGEGWRSGAAGQPVPDTVRRLAAAGIRRFEVTAIARDGLLDGPDIALLAETVAEGAGQVIASGGIASLADLRSVAEAGCAGAIIGRALYEGRLDLREALTLAAGLG